MKEIIKTKKKKNILSLIGNDVFDDRRFIDFTEDMETNQWGWRS